MSFRAWVRKQTVDFTLEVARSSETVEVSREAPILNPENANTSTTLGAPALEDLPNPGGDLPTHCSSLRAP